MDCKIVEIDGSYGKTIVQGDKIIKCPTVRDEDLKGELGRRPIGVGSISSFNGTFTDESIVVQVAGIGAYVFAKIGDIQEAYDMLRKKLEGKSLTLEVISTAVFEVVDEYFGRFDNISARMSFYKDEDIIHPEDGENLISALKGKSSAMCVERAALSQNLLKSIGINSLFKASPIRNNGIKDLHAYNLVEFEGKYYIFDTTIPTLRDGKISPIITEIPKEVFDSISMPLYDGYSVEISHFNPLRNKDYDIIYDTFDRGLREKYINMNESKDKALQ